MVVIEIDDRTLGVMYRSFRRNRSRGERIDAPREVQLAHESLRLPTSVRARARNASKQSPRPNHGCKQPPGGHSVPKIQPVRDQPLHTQM